MAACVWLKVEAGMALENKMDLLEGLCQRISQMCKDRNLWIETNIQWGKKMREELNYILLWLLRLLPAPAVLALPRCGLFLDIVFLLLYF